MGKNYCLNWNADFFKPCKLLNFASKSIVSD